MRYQFIGFPVPYKGKPIWEIVGNLKNFGVGRLIVADEHKDKFDEPSFYKIVKVQPMDTPAKVGEIRSVLLWAEYVLRGRKLTQLEQLQPESCLTKFHLIPKDEEDKYIKGITNSPALAVIPKYQSWPPLFKIIWEQRMKKITGEFHTIPPLNTVIETGEKSFEVLTSEDVTEKPSHSDMFKADMSVEDLYKKIVVLRQELGIEEEETNEEEY